jgi:DNA-binding NtrC family response regulator
MLDLNAGITCYKLGDYPRSKERLGSSLALGISGGYLHRQCFANIALGNVHRLTRDFEAARRHLHTAYNQAQELQYPREEALALEFLGDVYRDEGQAEAARRFYARAMAIALKIAPEGDVVMELRRRNGECFGIEGRPADALPELQRALDMSRAQKDRFEEGVTLRVMAEVAYQSNDLAAARRFIDKASALLQEIGARHEAAIALLHSVDVRLAEIESGRADAPAAELLEQAWRQATAALDLFLRVDVRWWTDRCRATVARVSAMRAAAGRTNTKPGSSSTYTPGDVVVHAGSAMRDLLQLCDMFASCPDPVLITGETGTGKEVLARRLHRHGSRADRPLVVVNVAAIPHTMFEREFFGHTRGAFSGAERDSVGFAAQADGGTLFLDEIGELPLEVQPKLLRLLQEGTYQAIGDPKPRSVDIRLIAATNANLRQMVADGRFRADLYYRLQTLELDILPLRERPEDVLPLLRHFLSLAAERQVDLAEYFNRRSLAELTRHDWPGNAREVAIVARRAHLGLSTRGSVQVAVPRADGPSFLAEGPHDTPAPPPPAPPGLTAEETAERTRILLAIEESGGSRLHAARTLGMGRSTLYRKLTQLGIATRRD